MANVIETMDSCYPPALAEEWDQVGLIAGDPNATVRRVGFAVDPCEATVREAIERDADLLITHHPLFLRGTSSVAATSSKGSWIHRLIKNDVALFAAHTNADSTADGTAAAFASMLGLTDTRPLSPAQNDPTLGIGRVGTLPLTMSVRELAQRIAALIPTTPAGVSIGGNPETIVSTVAVCPGSGDSFLDEANAVADVYITADLRHHPATDHLWGGGCPLIGLGHFASEWPVLPNLARRLESELGVETYVSTIITDPWTERL